MKKDSLRGVLIGCGYASWFQLEAWKRIPSVEIVAVSSRNIENAQKRAAEFNIPQVYTDYREMLDTEVFDFVDISTPPVVHLEMIKESAERGFHVLAAVQEGVDIVGLSALLTTTMPSMENTIKAIQNAGLRDHVKVIIGGAPVTAEYAQKIGADGYAPDASQAMTLAKSLMA